MMMMMIALNVTRNLATIVHIYRNCEIVVVREKSARMKKTD